MTTKLSSKQKQALKEGTKRINLFEGCVRSGKTFVANTLFLEQMYSVPYDKFLLTGKTKDTLKRNVTEDLIKIIGASKCEYNAHMGELKYKVGNENRTVYCVGALDERSVGRIQGGTFGSWYADERVTHPENFCEMARTRLSVPSSRIFWTCNPDSPYHPVYKNYIEKRDTRDDLCHIHFDIEDNPSLTEEYKDELKNTFTGIFYRRMILGEWVLAEGIIYDSFGYQHIIDYSPEIKKFFISIDYGTASVTVFLLFGLGVDGKVYVLKEWYHDAEASRYQMTDPELVQALRKFISFNNLDENDIWRIFPDPSASSFIIELKHAGFPVYAADNDVLSGIRTVSSGFYKNNLLIHKSCETLISEISNSYVWDDKAKKRGEDSPLKRNDHRSDTLRYGYYTYKLNEGASTSSTFIRDTNNLNGIPTINSINDYKEELRFSWRAAHKSRIKQDIFIRRKKVSIR